MTSSSALGYTQITLQFGRGRTVDSAAGDVQAAINATAGQLPANLLNPPIYRKTNPADTPILLLALTSETLPLTKVSDYANSILAQKLSQVPASGSSASAARRILRYASRSTRRSSRPRGSIWRPSAQRLAAAPSTSRRVPCTVDSMPRR